MKDLKGGYQIVEIASGNVGMYKALEAAYNAKKPILVKKGDNCAFGNVTKDGNYYVANYIIDDVLHQDTISALDAITDSSTDIGGAGAEIEALEDRVNANKMLVASRTLLDTYDNANNPFVCQSDGYINYKVAGVSGNAYGLTIYDPGSSGAQALTSRFVNGTTSDQYIALFVKKGMRITCNTNSGTGNYGYFIPLEN